jgi:hypothetical protein
MTKTAVSGVAALMLSLFLFPCRVGGEGPEGPVAFRWSFVAVTTENGGDAITPIVKDTVLKTGDQFKILVAPEKGTFVYLLYRSSQDELHLLYPARPSAYDTAGAGGAAILPPGGQWFRLDEHPGEEVFFLMAADQRLSTLENLLQRHEKAETLAEREAAADRILEEIRRLRWENRGFKSTAERPTAVMGQLRGVKKPPKIDIATVDVADHATRIEARGFYSRTFTIEHRQ